MSRRPAKIAGAAPTLAEQAHMRALLSKLYAGVEHRLWLRVEQIFEQLSSVDSVRLQALRLSDTLAVFAPRLDEGQDDVTLACSEPPGFLRVSAPVAGAAVTAAAVAELRHRLPEDIDGLLEVREQALRAWLAARASESQMKALSRLVVNALRPTPRARRHDQTERRAEWHSKDMRSEFMEL